MCLKIKGKRAWPNAFGVLSNPKHLRNSVRCLRNPKHSWVSLYHSKSICQWETIKEINPHNCSLGLKPHLLFIDKKSCAFRIYNFLIASKLKKITIYITCQKPYIKKLLFFLQKKKGVIISNPESFQLSQMGSLPQLSNLDQVAHVFYYP